MVVQHEYDEEVAAGFSLVCVDGRCGPYGVSGTGINGMLAKFYERDMKGLTSMKNANLDLMFIARELREAIIAKDGSEIPAPRKRRQVYCLDPEGSDDSEKTLSRKRAGAELARPPQPPIDTW